MVEMNPRAVPLCHIPLGPGRDLVQAILERITGTSRKPRIAATGQDLIIYFPGLSADTRQSAAGGRLSRCSMART